MKRLTIGLMLTILAIFVLQGCSKKEAGDAASVKAKELKAILPHSNVVVILIDTLRADHLPFYGYPKNTAPFLSKLAEKSVLFERPFSSSSTTAPATASIFTSLYPSDHGVIIGQIAMRHLLKKHPKLVLNRIPEALTILPEAFKNADYSTFAVNDNLNISHEMGYSQGFDKFETYRYQGAETINTKLKEWKDEISGSEKYFVYIHYMDPHAPYNEQAPWYKAGANKRENIVNAYDSEINYVDSKIQEMFELFGWEEDTLVVVTADHGEEFWEHGKVGHGKSLYTEVIHVPFFIYHPKLKAIRVSDYVSTIDLLPTVANLVGLKIDPVWEGVSLVPTMEGHLLPERMFHSQLLRKKEHRKASMASVISHEWHLIRTDKLNGDSRFELFDIVADFDEFNDQSANKPAIVTDLNQAIDELQQSKPALKAEEIEIDMDPERLDQLKSLGYVE